MPQCRAAGYHGNGCAAACQPPPSSAPEQSRAGRCAGSGAAGRGAWIFLVACRLLVRHAGMISAPHLARDCPGGLTARAEPAGSRGVLGPAGTRPGAPGCACSAELPQGDVAARQRNADAGKAEQPRREQPARSARLQRPRDRRRTDGEHGGHQVAPRQEPGPGVAVRPPRTLGPRRIPTGGLYS